MTDWTTARVVRDGKGRLRTDDGPIRGLVGDGLVSAESAAAYEHMLGPLVPVLDADGQPTVTPAELAAAWDEGHEAGHEDARAVQSTYPEPTPNPYRAEGEPR